MRNLRSRFTCVTTAAAAGFLLQGHASAQQRRAAPTLNTRMNQIAEQYVKLVLAVGQHDKDYVDAFYGPKEWQAEAAAAKKSLGTIRTEADRPLHELDGIDVT